MLAHEVLYPMCHREGGSVDRLTPRLVDHNYIITKQPLFVNTYSNATASTTP